MRARGSGQAWGMVGDELVPNLVTGVLLMVVGVLAVAFRDRFGNGTHAVTFGPEPTPRRRQATAVVFGVVVGTIGLLHLLSTGEPAITALAVVGAVVAVAVNVVVLLRERGEGDAPSRAG